MDEPMGNTTKITFGRLLELFEPEAKLERPLNPDNFSPNLILNRAAKMARSHQWSTDIAFGAYLIARWINADDLVTCSRATLALFVNRAARWLAEHIQHRVLWFTKAVHTAVEYETKLWQIIDTHLIYRLLPY